MKSWCPYGCPLPLLWLSSGIHCFKSFHDMIKWASHFSKVYWHCFTGFKSFSSHRYLEVPVNSKLTMLSLVTQSLKLWTLELPVLYLLPARIPSMVSANYVEPVGFGKHLPRDSKNCKSWESCPKVSLGMQGLVKQLSVWVTQGLEWADNKKNFFLFCMLCIIRT